MVELIPTDGRKSFYGKAVVKSQGDVLTLRSYSTNVCTYNTATGEFKRLWSGYSATSMRHVNAFIDTYCPTLYGAGGKKWWCEQAVAA